MWHFNTNNQKKIANFYAQRNPPPRKTFIKVFGCSNLTSFNTAKISQIPMASSKMKLPFFIF